MKINYFKFYIDFFNFTIDNIHFMCYNDHTKKKGDTFMAIYKSPGRCAVCGGALHVTQLTCDTCESTLQGNFTPCRFCALDDQTMAFLEIFIKNRGSIKDIEREMGISYPTVRNNIDNLLSALGFASETKPLTKKEILDKLSKREITSTEALHLLETIDEVN